VQLILPQGLGKLQNECCTTIEAIVKSQAQVNFGRAHFISFGKSSLDFEVVYFVLSGDYDLYMDAQQAINLSIVRSFADAGIDFAFPTRTLHLHKA
jgi:small-conductance mechanosensitive channel